MTGEQEKNASDGPHQGSYFLNGSAIKALPSPPSNLMTWKFFNKFKKVELFRNWTVLFWKWTRKIKKIVEKSTVRFLKSGIPSNSLFRKKTFIGYRPFRKITFFGGFPKPVEGIQYSKYVYCICIKV